MSTAAEAMTESQFRQLAKSAYDRVEAQFDAVDPDQVECEVAQGALTLTLADGARWVLSQQPPVRQLLIDGVEVSISALGDAADSDYVHLSDGCRRILTETSHSASR